MIIQFFKSLYKPLALSICFVESIQALSVEQELRACKPALLVQLNGQKRLPTKGCPVAQNLGIWLGTLRNPDQFSPQELMGFLSSHSHWPQYNKLCKNAEEVIAKQAAPYEILTWFGKHPPQTPIGVIAYGKTLLSQNKKTQARDIVRKGWTTLELTGNEEKDFLTHFSKLLNEKDHIARVRFLLLNESVDEVKRHISRLPAHFQRVVATKIALIKNKSDALCLLNSLPPESLRDEGLLYHLTNWHRKRGEFQEATKILLTSPCTSPFIEKWWREQNYIARELIALRDFKTAYQLLAKHKQNPGSENFADAEWLLGWMSLRFLRNPKQAERHFATFCSHVQSAISKARGAYWMGRTYEDLKKVALAKKWYQKAAQYKTTYYGQLGAAKLRIKPFPDLTDAPRATPDEKKAFEQKDLVKAALMIKALGSPAAHELSKFLSQIASEAKTKSERELAVQFAHALSPRDIVWTAKKAGNKEPVLLKKAYPTHAIPQKGQPLPEKALVMAIAYKESQFNPNACSPADARGLLQIIPKTGELIAKDLGIYHNESLLYDPHHNLVLGSTYISSLLNDFDHSYVLTSAAYNAGPGRVQRWLRDFGDPRQGQVDIVDWIELIPFSETRTYVMRVLENVSTYRSREGNLKKTIIDDLSH